MAALSTFVYRSVIDAPAMELFRWYEQPGALAALSPPALVRIDAHEGGIRDGGTATLSIGIGSARVRWVARHYGYIAGRQFCDEQLSGPFAVWRHTHRFEPISRSQTMHEDRIEFAAFHHGLLSRLATFVLRPLLRQAFAQRHRIIQTRVGRARVTGRRSAATAALVIAAVLLQATAVAAQTAAPPRTVPFVDLDRYAGDWYEVARFPNRFQRQCTGDVRASYARRSDGRIDVLNRCRTAAGQTEAHGVARVVDEKTFARLKVRFAPVWLGLLPFVWGDYWVLGLASDYSWAVVGSPDREYLWMLARTPQLDAERAAAAREIARTNGYDISRLVPTSNDGGSQR